MIPSHFNARLLMLALPLTLNAYAGEYDTIAQMGDTTLKVGDLNKLIAQTPVEARNPQAVERLARTEILRKHLAAEARRQGLDSQPEVAERMKRVAEQTLVSAYMDNIARPAPDFPPESLIKEAYETNKASLMTPRQFRVSQIYVAGLDAQAKKSAEVLYTEASGKNADFAAIAKKSSKHAASAARGGDMGWLAEKEIQPAIAGAIAKLKKGAIGKPVKGADGYHILRVTEIKEAQLLPLDKARPSLIQSLRLRKAREIEAAHLDGLMARMPVTVNEAGLKEVLGTK